ncbi:hypothetical protein JOD31_001376 [Methylopila capsulata]|uniref:Uncharacterized protein n=1 Tax=Methylopila capsulata TaxID=61654 RepID=A0A9W6MQF4_9HYPH|nr:hypothetical protein [Methylopila capsulata]MBM7851151.1 hypothetical protein [Methylopila capsulata]GLK54208.1 hypothetical protein GCM10008170_02270 [Methylopila capsulata]
MSLHAPSAAALVATLALVSSASAQQPPSASQAAAALVGQGVAARAVDDAACPRVVALKGAESFPRGKGGANQATLGGLARDCADLGAETLVKVAVTGDGVRATTAGPSWFNAPLTIAVLDDRGQAVATRRAKVKVQLPRGATSGPFAYVVEDLSLPPAKDYAGWSVVVGFEMSQAELQRAAKVVTAGR